MKTKSTFLALNALMSPALVHGSPNGKGPVLPMPSIGRNVEPTR